MALVDIYSSYAPRIIRERIAMGLLADASPSEERLSAAVFFADISGFTRLTESMSQAAGVETLTTILNAYLSRLIELIEAAGGDVVKFAGDALLAIWPAAASSEVIAVQRAAMCGLAIQTHLHNYSATEAIALSVRIGISVGDISLLRVGGHFQRWEILIAGAPLKAMARAEALAERGEVVLAPAALACLSQRAETEARPEGYARLLACPPQTWQAQADPALPLTAIQTLRRTIPGAIIARLDAGQTDWLAELRRIAVLFINLPELDCGDLSQVQLVMRSLQEQIYRYEGSINKLIVDDKGTTLIAAYGLPPLAHAEDPLRAIKAALAIQSRVPTPCAIGITTSQVFCGAVGSERRREYTLIGDGVNTAARLMQAAGVGTIWCDAATATAARSQMQFDALPPVMLKGKAEPITVFSPLGARVHDPSVSQFVGRDAEVAALKAAIAHVQAGEGQRLWIEAEAGFGKSWLVQFVVSEVEAVTVLQGAGDSIEQATPYSGWRQILTRLCGTDAPSLETLAAIAPAELHPLLPLLGPVWGIEFPDNDTTAEMLAQVQADNRRALIVALLRGVAPVLVVLDDAHWLDSASWDVVFELVRQAPDAIALWLLCRPFTYPARLKRDLWQRLDLLPLSPEAVEHLLAAYLDVETIPALMRDSIVEKAAGHPFFSIELAYAFRDTGIIRVEGRAARLQTRQIPPLPDTVQGAITSRIDRLPPTEQLTLKVASVLGRQFIVSTLADIYPLPDDRTRLGECLQHLDQVQLTLAETPPPEARHSFRQAITQDVVYSLMLIAQRQQLHHAIAQWYEQHGAGDAPLLAHHWLNAAQPQRAVPYLAQAGARALASFANPEAVTYLEQALQWGETWPNRDRALWHTQLGEAQMRLGNLAVSQTQLQAALALFGYPAPTQKRQVLGGLLRQIGAQLGWPLKRPAPLMASHAYRMLGEIHFYANEPLYTLHGFLATLNLAEAAYLPTDQARAYANMAIAAGGIPWHALARYYTRKAETMLERLPHPATAAFVHSRLSVYELGVCQWQSIASRLAITIETAHRLGDQRLWSEGIALLSWGFCCQGQHDRAITMCQDLYRHALRSGDMQAQAWGLIGQAENFVLQRNFTDAIAVLDEAAALSPECIGRVESLRVLALRNWTLIRLGQTVDPHELQYLLVQPLPTAVYLLGAYVSMAATAIQLEAKPLIAIALRNLGSYARIFPVGRPYYLGLQALATQGNPSRAERLLQESRQSAESLGMPELRLR